MDTNSNETMTEFLDAHGQWELMDPQLKDYVTTTNADVTATKIDGNYRAWQAMNPKEVAMNIKSNHLEMVAEIQRSLKSIPDEDVYVNVEAGRIYTAGSPTGAQQMYATGTNFHKGGLAIPGRTTCDIHSFLSSVYIYIFVRDTF